MPAARKKPDDGPVNTTDETDGPVPVPADAAVGDDARELVPLAGLLADQPNLRDELHTPEEWRELLDAYNASERI